MTEKDDRLFYTPACTAVNHFGSLHMLPFYSKTDHARAAGSEINRENGTPFDLQ